MREMGRPQVSTLFGTAGRLLRETSRPWVSTVENSIIRPRHQFGTDGRLLLFPIAIPFCLFGLFSRMPVQLYWYGGAFVCFLIARTIYQFWPWLIDDALAEWRVPKWFIDVPYGD